MKNKSNDDIPEDEMLLAKLLQNVNVRGLKWTKGAFMRDAKGWNTNQHKEVVSCCAMGAAALETDSDADAANWQGIIAGNDREEWYEYFPTTRDGESLGAAFRVAMQED